MGVPSLVVGVYEGVSSVSKVTFHAVKPQTPFIYQSKCYRFFV